MRISDMIAERSEPFVSLEFFPPKDRKAWQGFFEAVERLKDLDPLFASVTYGAGGGTQENTLEIVRGVKERGLTPLAHLTCVQASEERIEGFLNELESVGADNVLALRGDPPRGSGCAFVPDNERFRHAIDLVRFIKKRHPEMCVGVACYPEPHPESATVREDLEWTRIKLEMADFATSQLFFDNRAYFDMVDRLAAMGVHKPIIPGVLPIPSVKSAKFILGLCGANIPGKLLLALEEAEKEGGAEATRKIGTEHAREQVRGLMAGGAPGVHLYTLNKADHCLEVMEGVEI